MTSYPPNSFRDHRQTDDNFTNSLRSGFFHALHRKQLCRQKGLVPQTDPQIDPCERECNRVADAHVSQCKKAADRAEARCKNSCKTICIWRVPFTDLCLRTGKDPGCLTACETRIQRLKSSCDTNRHLWKDYCLSHSCQN